MLDLFSVLRSDYYPRVNAVFKELSTPHSFGSDMKNGVEFPKLNSSDGLGARDSKCVIGVDLSINYPGRKDAGRGDDVLIEFLG